MSDSKADHAHPSPAASSGHTAGHEDHAVDFTSYVRRCAVVFLAVLCTTSAMIATSFSHIGDGWTLKVSLILAIAIVNAFLVAGYLMHLLSEKKLIYTVLAFTVCFFIGLMGLTLWAMGDFPMGTAVH
jgi:caa(3)-type oxidase subunit IV